MNNYSIDRYSEERTRKEIAQMNEYFDKNIKNNPKEEQDFWIKVGIIDKKGKPTAPYKHLLEM